MPRNRDGNRRRGSNSVNIAWDKANINSYLTQPGLYAFKILKAQENDDGTSIIFDLEVTSEGRQNGRMHRSYFNTVPRALWVLARLLDAVGVDVPDTADDLDLDELVDKEFMAEVAVHRWNDEDKLRIEAKTIVGIDEVEEPAALSSKRPGRKAEVEEDEPAPRSRRSKEPEPEDEPEEEVVEKEPRRRGRPAGSKNKVRNTEPEEEEKPSRKSSKNKLPQMSASEIEDMNEEELDDLVEKYDLEVDLSKDRTLSKKAARVCDELDSKGLLSDE